jgi:hypothetical protein
MKQTIYIEYELALNPIYNAWEYLNLPSLWIHNPISDTYKNNSAHVIESFSGPSYNKDDVYSFLNEFFENLELQ